MASRPSDLPDFENPPVAEVILGMQFKRLPKFGAVHLGLSASLFQNEFPRVQEVPPLDPTFEVFGTSHGTEHVPKISLVTNPVTRLWLINDEKTQLIQIQPDRFIRNWRKVATDGVYPRYEKIRAGFESCVNTFSKFLDTKQLGRIAPNQCEVSYVNHIELPDGANWWGSPGEVFVNWNNGTPDPMYQVEDVRFITRHLLRSDSGSAQARLICQVEPGINSNGKSVISFTLSVRGRPASEAIESVLEFFDTGRECIVRQFAAMTTKKMHEIWGRKK